MIDLQGPACYAEFLDLLVPAGRIVEVNIIPVCVVGITIGGDPSDTADILDVVTGVRPAGEDGIVPGRETRTIGKGRCSIRINRRIDRPVVIRADIHVPHLVLGVGGKGMVLDGVESPDAAAAHGEIPGRHTGCDGMVGRVNGRRDKGIITGCVVEVTERKVGWRCSLCRVVPY
ncbi:MAG: hypothetical protein A4E33_01743 [Methanoregula sp. PtaB.Bin085]|nr:MAG: hypothetical protein A4E33_01743 [Methanoregula sp. PtaB.Bin085]